MSPHGFRMPQRAYPLPERGASPQLLSIPERIPQRSNLRAAPTPPKTSGTRRPSRRALAQPANAAFSRTAPTARLRLPRTPLPYRPASPTRQGPCRRRRKRRPCRRSLSCARSACPPARPGCGAAFVCCVDMTAHDTHLTPLEEKGMPKTASFLYSGLTCLLSLRPAGKYPAGL